MRSRWLMSFLVVMIATAAWRGDVRSARVSVGAGLPLLVAAVVAAVVVSTFRHS